ncbi:uncharacterized protein Z519_03572 [Cladophialophora bantiana CBS 173.52]|uniref:Uncharacterized protein n=1 Tax=Cladophialophora bantiana (strain ATCC 10958 / CBS 173.52 / CDC B-1940 / NIH 8579) TaxID=1442370 RepID=A0A0D2HST7_CLAB1|nr:uncharacterized protein Z519_03572 [Cladophialophora bantiana CBS 173.52]KIW96503.1 hypothetical protein Z519_03572 [Cladophialophora bantiana CBS 173.52]
MPDEEWRDEIQEYALLLDAVASGDRSRVVKHLTDYILGKKEGGHGSQSNKEESEEKREQYYEQNQNDYEYYEEHEEEYNEPHAETNNRFVDEDGNYTEEDKNFGYEEEQYQYDNSYDELAAAEYDLSAAKEGYYEGPYMSGAYNEPDNGADTYEEDPYGDYTDPNPAPYGNEVYRAEETEIADENYTVGTYAGSSSNNYESHSYPEDQQYDGEYYDQEADGTYNDWNPEADNYHYQQGAERRGGEWHEEPGYRLVSDDQIQEVVGEVNLYELGDVHPEEYQIPAYDDPAHPEEHQQHPAEEQLYNDDDHVFPSHHQEYSQQSQTYPHPYDIDEFPNHHQEYAQQNQTDPEDDLFSYDTTEEAPPKYSVVPRYAINPNPQTQYVPYRPYLTTSEKPAAVDDPNRITRVSINDHTDGFGSRTSVSLADDEDEWEDETCEEEGDGMQSPPSDKPSGLQLNPFSHQHEWLLSMPTEESSQSKVT